MEREMEYRTEFEADSSGIWYTNALRFTDHADAVAECQHRAMVWTAVRRGRVVSDDTPLRETVDPTDSQIVVSYAN
jgi:hypothetical protein